MNGLFYWTDDNITQHTLTYVGKVFAIPTKRGKKKRKAKKNIVTSNIMTSEM